MPKSSLQNRCLSGAIDKRKTTGSRGGYVPGAVAEADPGGGRRKRRPVNVMKSNRALLLTLTTIIGALLVSVMSYAQTTPASATNVITAVGVNGGTGSPVSQDVPGAADLVSVALSGSTTLPVSDTGGFASGASVLSDDGSEHACHTVPRGADGVRGLGVGTAAGPRLVVPPSAAACPDWELRPAPLGGSGLSGR